MNPMSCCGQKRHALRDASRIPRRAPEPQAYAPPFQNPMLMQHTGASSLIVRGAVTRHAYLFGPRGAALAVDERDAPGLIATGLFEAQG
jgi:hypothetical protein